MGIPARLKEERERLLLTQTGLAERIGSTKRSIINWEGGAASPSAEAIASMAALDADVLYILTGQRSKPLESTLTPRQKALLDNYSHTDAEGQRAIEQVALLAAKQGMKKKKAA